MTPHRDESGDAILLFLGATASSIFRAEDTADNQPAHAPAPELGGSAATQPESGVSTEDVPDLEFPDSE